MLGLFRIDPFEFEEKPPLKKVVLVFIETKKAFANAKAFYY